MEEQEEDPMRNALLLAAAGIVCLPLLSVGPARAQPFTRTWVSGLGSDGNPCTRALPCRTFAGAIIKTTINGEINCVDAGDFGTPTELFIDKSVTIDCQDFAGSSISGGENGIFITVPPGNPNDPLRTVRLRGLRISGAGLMGSAGTRIGARGIQIHSALHVFLDDVLITQFTQQGILDQRTGSGNLYIRNTVVRDNGLTGIVVTPTSGSVDVVIDNAQSNRNNFGLSAGPNSRVVVNNSVFMGNAVQGIHADAGGRLNIERSVINGNTTGIGADAGSTVRLANTDVMFNGTGISGNTFSFTNNRIVDNGFAGTPPTAIGVASSETGQR
jgi:Right handed beta helix region